MRPIPATATWSFSDIVKSGVIKYKVDLEECDGLEKEGHAELHCYIGIVAARSPSPPLIGDAPGWSAKRS